MVRPEDVLLLDGPQDDLLSTPAIIEDVVAVAASRPCICAPATSR